MFRFFFSTVVVTQCTLWAAWAAVDHVSASEMSGLEYLYNSTNGTYWRWRPAPEFGKIWEFPSTNPCDWQGITCNCADSSECAIADVILPGYSLEGTIPVQMSLLTNLNSLDLSDNRLGDSELSAICGITSLVNMTTSSAKINSQIPSCFGDLLNLEVLAIDKNRLEGSLPTEIGLMSSLRNFKIGSNLYLTGPLPTSLCGLPEIMQLDVEGNMFTGSIPTCYGELTNLVHINIDKNELTGPLPTALCNLQMLGHFNMGTNSLTSTLPPCLGSLASIWLINVVGNRLTGTLPSALFDLSSLYQLTINYNHFSGTISPLIVNMNQLAFLALDNCQFTGPLPPVLPPGVVNIFFEYNQFTGTIPAGLCSSPSGCIEIYFLSNFLTGTVPAALGQMESLVFFSITENFITGELPTSMVGMSELLFIYVNKNMMSGSDILSFLSPSVQSLMLSENLFSGTFPFSTPGLSLSHVYLRDNYFTGFIPSDLTALVGGIKLDLSNNQFSGTLPSTLNTITELDTFAISANRLFGDLNTVFFDSLANDHLRVVDFSNNAFSGSLPSALLARGRLREFIAGSNCFSGSISTAVCNATNLQVLDLSGMTSGVSCTIKYGAFYAVKTVPGHIPECIFALEQLKEVSLSGNGMRTPLGNMSAGSILANLSLAYNRIVGSIPLSMKEHRYFQKLDLSYNRIGGTLDGARWFDNNSHSADVVVNQTYDVILRLESNRLSGYVPPSFDSATSMDILNGNMFQCNQQFPLPHNDIGREHYSCGSRILNNSMYGVAAFVVLRVSLFALFVLVLKNASVMEIYFRQMMSLVFLDSKPKHSGNMEVDLLASMLGRFRFYSMIILVLILVVCIPLYLGLKSTAGYSTHTYEYGWVVSLAFLQDATPATVIFTLWMVALPCFVIFDIKLSRQFRNVLGESDELVRVNAAADLSNPAPPAWHLVLAVLCNVMVMLLVNGGYVYVLLTYSFQIQTVAVVLTSMFKVCWTTGVVHQAINYLQGSASLLLITTVINNVIMPIIGTVFVDIDCYQSVFVAAETIQDHLTLHSYQCSFGYNIPETGNITNTTNKFLCAYIPLVVPTTYDPPFIYSDQCSSSLLTNYVPIYVLMFGLLNVLIAVAQFGMLIYFSDAAAPGQEVKLALAHKLKDNIDWYSMATMGIVDLRLIPLEATDNMDRISHHTGGSLYNLREVGVSCSVSLLFLITYGAAYPPLAVILCMDMVFTTALRQLCVHQHLQQLQALPELLSSWTAGLRVDMLRMSTVLFGPKPVILILAAAFASIFIYDIASSVSKTLAVVLVSVLTIWSAVLSVIYFFYEKKLKLNAVEVQLERAFDAVKTVSTASVVNMVELKRFSTDNSNDTLDWPTVAPPLQTPSVVPVTATSTDSDSTSVSNPMR